MSEVRKNTPTPTNTKSAEAVNITVLFRDEPLLVNGLFIEIH